MNTTVLAALADGIAQGTIHIIDLTQTLSERFPTLQLPEQFGQAQGFKKEAISCYDEKGPGWYWNNFSCSEHTGTHFDAPAHWITGREHAQNTVDTIDLAAFIGPAVVVDASREVQENPDWLLTVDYLKSWEQQHGEISPGSWLLFRTDWSKKAEDAQAFLNMRDDGAHTPGPTQEAVEWLIHERRVRGFGVETINTDAGQSWRWSLPYPCHTLMHGANKYGLQCLTQLDKLPVRGAVLIAAPLKIEQGSGSPLRVLALVAKS